MITKLKLVNWRSHLESEIDFSPGINVFTGIMGSGKTSITNAICFGLFGTFPDLQTKKLKIDDVIMSKPHLKDKAEVTVSFALNGDEYSVFRAIERGKGTTYSELRKGEKLIDAPQAQRVTEQIQDLLKIDYELFSKAIYSEQNGLDYFLRLSRGERMKRIDNLLMIDKYEKARSSAVTLKNRINERKLAKQNLIDQVDLQLLETTISEMNLDIKQMKENKKHLETIQKEIKITEEKLEKELKNYEQVERELSDLQQKRKSVGVSIEENQESIEEIKKLLRNRGPKEIKNRLAEVKNQLILYKEQLNNYLTEQEKLISSQSEYNTRIIYLEKDIDRYKSEFQKKSENKKKISTIKLKYGNNPLEVLESERKNMEKINSELTILENRLNDLNNIILQVENLEDECPICNSKISLDKKQHLIYERNSVISEINQNMKAKNIEKEKLQEYIVALEKITGEFILLTYETKDLESIENKLTELESSYREVNTELRKTKDEGDRIKKQISDVQIVVRRFEAEISELDVINSRLDELENRENKVIDHRNKLQEIEKKLLALISEVEKTDAVKLRNLYEESIYRKSELQVKINTTDEIFNEKAKRLKELEDKKHQIKNQVEEIKGLESLMEDLNIFEKALANTQIQLREEFIDTVNHTMNDIWPDIYPYTDFSGIRLAIEEGDYVLQLQDRSSRWIDVEGTASGGERSISALVLRIAFSLVLAPQLKWLILDEPTINLDSKAIEDLAETLRNRIGEFVSQVFLITHDKTLENASTGELYRLQRDKGTDGTTILEKATDI